MIKWTKFDVGIEFDDGLMLWVPRHVVSCMKFVREQSPNIGHLMHSIKTIKWIRIRER